MRQRIRKVLAAILKSDGEALEIYHSMALKKDDANASLRNQMSWFNVLKTRPLDWKGLACAPSNSGVERALVDSLD